jgi:hypothetical protein
MNTSGTCPCGSGEAIDTSGRCGRCRWLPTVPAPVMVGWRCPTCGINYAPHVASCGCAYWPIKLSGNAWWLSGNAW